MSLERELPLLSDKQILSVFTEFDTDQSGEISIDEFVKGIKRLQLPLSNEDITHLISIVDTNKDGKISFEEFKIFSKEQDKKIRSTFSSLDVNKDHSLSPNELRSALQNQLGLELSNEELHNFMTQFSSNDYTDQAILFSEFRQKVLLLPAINTRCIYDKMRPTHIDIGEDFRVPSDDADTYSRTNTFLSGAISGAVSRTCTAPMDRLKTLYQSGAMEKGAKMIDTVKNILNEGGLKSFWRGNGANGLKVAPESAIKFLSYDILKKYTCQYPDNPMMHERFIAGGLAGAISQSAIYPLEIAKTRLALSSTGEYNGIFHCLQRIGHKKGIRALYKGLGASLIGIIPYAGVDLGAYNTIKDWRAKQRMNDLIPTEPSAIEILLTGSFSSICGQVVAYPMQVIRTKLQSQGQCINLRLSDGSVVTKLCPEYKGFADCVRATIVSDGIRGFYKGILPNFMKAVPAISISYLVFEKSKTLFAPVI